jgi:hypothetical protein
MAYVERAILRIERWRHVCDVWGEPSEGTICEARRIKIRAEALAMKKQEGKDDVGVHPLADRCERQLAPGAR